MTDTATRPSPPETEEVDLDKFSGNPFYNAVVQDVLGRTFARIDTLSSIGAIDSALGLYAEVVAATKLSELMNISAYAMQLLLRADVEAASGAGAEAEAGVPKAAE